MTFRARNTGVSNVCSAKLSIAFSQPNLPRPNPDIAAQFGSISCLQWCRRHRGLQLMTGITHTLHVPCTATDNCQVHSHTHTHTDTPLRAHAHTGPFFSPASPDNVIIVIDIDYGQTFWLFIKRTDQRGPTAPLGCYTHTHAHTHTHRDTHMHTQWHTCICTHTHTDTQTHKRPDLWLYLQTCIEPSENSLIPVGQASGGRLMWNISFELRIVRQTFVGALGLHMHSHFS